MRTLRNAADSELLTSIQAVHTAQYVCAIRAACRCGAFMQPVVKPNHPKPPNHLYLRHPIGHAWTTTPAEPHEYPQLSSGQARSKMAISEAPSIGSVSPEPCSVLGISSAGLVGLID